MQRSLHHIFAGNKLRSGGAPSHPTEAQQTQTCAAGVAVNQTTNKQSATLLRLLHSDGTQKNRSDTADPVPTPRSTSFSATQPPEDSGSAAPTTKRPKQERGADTRAVSNQQVQDKQRNKQRCPICGDNVQADVFDAHLNQELEDLGAFDDHSDWSSEQHQQQPKHQMRNADGRNPMPRKPVYVLGGKPAVSASVGARKFPPQKAPASNQLQSALKGYNYYADGAGFLAGDDLGLDGHDGAGLAWEGMGAAAM